MRGAAQRKLVRELRLHRGRVGALAWAGHTLATGGQDRRIVLSDLRAPDPPPAWPATAPRSAA